MLVLAIETSTSQGSLAIARIENGKGTVLYAKSWLRQRSHGELVTPAIEEALKSSDIELSQVDAFAVGIGPGSFTGIRVGLNTVKSLAYGLDKPIYVFNSLELLAFAAPLYRGKTPLVALINAHKSQCYVATFKATAKGWSVSKKPQAMTIAKLESTIKSAHICVGEGFDFFAPTISKTLSKRCVRDSFLSDYPHAQTMVQILASQPKRHKPKSWNAIQALYIRSSEAEEKLKVGLLKPLPEY